MAVTFRGLTGASFSHDYQGNRTYSRTYRLHGNLTTDDEIAIKAALAANGVATFQPHPHDSLAKCLSVSASIVSRITEGGNKGAQWDATAEYGPIPPNYVPGGPLAQPATWRIDPVPVVMPAFLDKNGDPILNKAGDFFDPPLEYERITRRLTVFRNEAAPDLAAIEAVENKTNDAPWLLWDTGKVKALPIKIPDRLYDQESEQRFYPMEYTFDIDPLGWKKKVVNSGYSELDSGGNPVRIFDASGQELTEPALLDEDGHKLVPPITAGNIVILEIEILDSTDFTIFNLDDLDGLS